MATTNQRPRRHVEWIRGARLHYWVYGDDVESALTVMLHGLRGTHHGLELIAQRLPGRCIVPDLPGFGDSGPMVGHRHDVAGYAAAVTQLLERLGARGRPVALLGHSFGSVVAARVAATAAELVRELVLVNPIATPALRGPRNVLSRITAGYYWLGKALPEPIGRSVLSNKWAVLATGQAMLRTAEPSVRRFVHDSHLRQFSRFHSPALLSEAFEASVNHTVAEDASTLTMRTLLIAGENDDIAPLAGQRALAERIDKAQLTVLPNVGHLVHYEKPSDAAAAIQRFLGRHHD